MLCYAKLLQSCPTLCDPIDDSLPGSSVHGIFQARVLEWGAIAFSKMTNTWMQIPFILPYCACKLSSLSLWDETRLMKKTSGQWKGICQNFMKTSLGTTTSQPCGCQLSLSPLEMKNATCDGQSIHFLVIFPIVASSEVLSVRRSHLLSRLRIYTCLSYGGQDALTFSASQHVPRHLPPFLRRTFPAFLR